MKKPLITGTAAETLFTTGDISLTFLASWFSWQLKEFCRGGHSVGSANMQAQCMTECLSKLWYYLEHDEYQGLFTFLKPSMEKLKASINNIIAQCTQIQKIRLDATILAYCLPSFVSTASTDESTAQINTARENVEEERIILQTLYESIFRPWEETGFKTFLPVLSAIKNFVLLKENHRVILHGLSNRQIKEIADVVGQSFSIHILEQLLKGASALLKDEGDDIPKDERDLLLQNGLLDIVFNAIQNDDPKDYWSLPMNMKDVARALGKTDRQIRLYLKDNRQHLRKGSGQSYRYDTRDPFFAPLRGFNPHAREKKRMT